LGIIASRCCCDAGGHINPAVTFGLLLARKLTLTRAVFYMIMQCLGAICGAGVVKGFQKSPYEILGGGANTVSTGYSKGSGLGVEILGTFLLVYTVLSATDAKRSARDSHVPVSKNKCYFFSLMSFNHWNWFPKCYIWMVRSWHHYLLDLQCSWFTWQPFLLQAPVLTQPEVLVQPSSTTRTKLGMIM